MTVSLRTSDCGSIRAKSSVFSWLASAFILVKRLKNNWKDCNTEYLYILKFSIIRKQYWKQNNICGVWTQKWLKVGLDDRPKSTVAVLDGLDHDTASFPNMAILLKIKGTIISQLRKQNATSQNWNASLLQSEPQCRRLVWNPYWCSRFIGKILQAWTQWLTDLPSQLDVDSTFCCDAMVLLLTFFILFVLQFVRYSKVYLRAIVI